MSKKVIAAITFIASVFTINAYAIVKCDPATTQIETLPIVPTNISAGPDLPLGTVIYRGTAGSSTSNVIFTCTTDVSQGDTASINSELGIESAPYPLSPWTGSPYSSKVYTTNVPGIGIAIWYAGNAVTTSNPYRLGTDDIKVQSSTTILSYAAQSTFDFSLIKIGSTPPGNYAIDASTFPTAKVFYTANSNAVGFPITVRKVTFSGSLNVNAQTCTTPDVNVNLNTHDISELVSSSSVWVNYNLQLTNCPLFKGYYGKDNPVNMATGAYGAPTNNQFGLRLTPIDGVVDATNGIIQTAQTVDSATGIGIQVALDENGSKSPFNFSVEKVFTFPLDGRSTINIPMAARYIKTGTKITPGRADGKIAFTINYY